MRTFFTFTFVALLLLSAMPALAEDGEPTAAELARMILDGNEGEQMLVAKWLEQADRTLLLQVFKELRALRGKRPETPLRPRVGVKRGDLRLPPAPAPGPDGKHTLINAEVRVIDMPAQAAAAFLGAQRPTADQNAVRLTDVQAATLLRAVAEREDITLVSAPSITVYDGQKANVSVLNELSYLQDFDVEEAKDGKKIADPVVQTIQEGSVIDFQPSLARHGKSIGLQFSGTFAAVTRPIPTLERELPGSPGRTVKVQIPELRVLRLKTTVYVPNGGWVLIGGGILLEPKKGESMERVTLVHLRSLKIDGSFVKDLKPR